MKRQQLQTKIALTDKSPEKTCPCFFSIRVAEHIAETMTKAIF